MKIRDLTKSIEKDEYQAMAVTTCILYP
jgi:hypothetical protein